MSGVRAPLDTELPLLGSASLPTLNFPHESGFSEASMWYRKPGVIPKK